MKHQCVKWNLYKNGIDPFKEKIVQAVKDIKVGNPLNEETRMGALSSTEHREKVFGYIQGELVIFWSY